MKKILLALLLVATSYAANVQIRDLTTTTVLPSANDYMLVDGATNGTSKSLALNRLFQTSTRATLAALSVTNVASGVSVLVLGATSAGDGSGAAYYYNSSSTATPDGITVIQPTVGSGRWLIAKNIGGAPASVSAIGGIFSKAAVTHRFLTSINTDGTIGQAQPDISDLTGLGSMASQNSNAVAITGGTIAGSSIDGSTIGATTANAGTFTAIKGTFGIFTSPIAAYNAAGGGLYFGYDGTTSIIRSVADNAGNYMPISMQVGNGVQVGSFTSTGLTPSSAQNRRDTKANYNLIINVKDYGAAGDGATNDTPAINAAIAATGNYTTLYFPAGKYRLATPPSGFTGRIHVTLAGDGWSSEIFNDTGTAGGNSFTFTSSCAWVTIHDLAFTGTSSVRGSGIHLRLYGSNTTVKNCFFSGCSDFAVHLSNDAGVWSNNFIVTGCTFQSPLGDGVHVGSATDVVVSNNIFFSTGDDSIGVVADDPAHVPNRVVVTGNHIYNAGGIGSSGCGIRVAEATDVLIGNNQVYFSQEAGIRLTRYTSTTAYNSRVKVIGNKIYAANQLAGPLGAIEARFTSLCQIEGNTIDDPAHGGGISFLDAQELSITGNTIRQAPSRGINSDDGTTTNVAATWDGVVIKNNVIETVIANEGIYAVPASGKTITNLLIDGNYAKTLASGSFIYYDRITTGRVVNNTRLASATITAGGTVSAVTTANNN